jgi:Ca2+-binding RTX toxin-like protein
MGKDELAGNSGNDTFIFNSVAESPAGNARDVIDDFEQGSDVIDLTSIDADVTGGGLSDPFTFIGTTPFDNIAGELRYRFEPGNTVVEGDVNGDGTADFQIELVSQIALTASDFLL